MDIMLIPITDFSFTRELKTAPIIPAEGGIVQGIGVKVNFPQNVLGTDTSAGSIEIKSTTNFPETADIKIIGGQAKDVIVRDSSQQIITTLSGTISLELTITKQEIINAGAAFNQLENIKISYWDSTANSWISIPTISKLNPVAATAIADLNSDPAVILLGSVGHLSYFAPTLPTSINAPQTPPGFTITAGNGQAILSWGASMGAVKYNIYQQSASVYPYLAATSQTSYTVSGLINGTTYSFKVSSLDTNDNESAATSAATVTPVSVSSGGSGNLGGGGGGGGGGGTWWLPKFIPETSASSIIINWQPSFSAGYV